MRIPDAPSPFSSAEALRFGWSTTKRNLKPLLALGVAGAFLALLDEALMRRHGGGMPSLGVAFLQAAVALAFLRSALKLHDGQPPQITRLGELLESFFPYLFTAFLYALIVVGGLVLFVVPGVIWGLRFAFAGFVVADGGTDPLAALRESSRLTAGAKGQLFELAALALCLNLLGALALGLGLFFTIPTTLIAGAFVFRRLQARATQRTEGPALRGAAPPSVLAGGGTP